jgi:hypothetical protein
MGFIPGISDKQLQNEDRRSHPRRRFEQLDYADFGPDNGGISSTSAKAGWDSKE